MAKPIKFRLGEILVQQNLISQQQLEDSLVLQKQTGRKLEPSPQDTQEELAALFDPVGWQTLQKMFGDIQDKNVWQSYVEHAKRNGLKDAAKAGRALFNPLLAGVWWLKKNNPKGWDMARLCRVLANNLPPRTKGNEDELERKISEWP